MTGKARDGLVFNDLASSIVEKALEAHRPAEDWHCSCGEDLFGGSAAYSWALFKSHAATRILAALEGDS